MEVHADRWLRRFHRRFERELDEVRLPQGWRVLAAVSGGCDSVVLTRLLHEAAGRSQGTLLLGHINHRLRDETRDEEQFVRALGRQWRLPVYVRRVSPRRLAKETGWSLEHAARAQRYEALAAVAAACGATAIALGHHMDDQAETVLLRLLRGTGPRGLGAMAPRSRIRPATSADEEVVLLRPLLSFRRAEIREFAERARLRWVEDRSNADVSLLRNRIRHELIPQLSAQYNPRLIESLAELAHWQRIESEPVASAAAEVFQRAVVQPEESGGADRLILEGLALVEPPEAVASRTLWLAYQHLAGPEAVLGSRHVQELLAMLNVLRRAPDLRSAEPVETHLPGRMLARLDRGRFVFQRHEPGPSVSMRARPAGRKLLVRRAANGTPALREGEVRRVEFAESIFEIERVAGRTEDLMETDAAVFDAGGLDPPLHVRGWRQGDGFVPFGMKGRKKVSDLLNEQAIPVAQRASVAIVEDRRSILWVVGLRRSNRAPITERTGAYIRIRTRRAPESS